MASLDSGLMKVTLNEQIELVEALYPNPTTGVFVVTFRNELSKYCRWLSDDTCRHPRFFSVADY